MADMWTDPISRESAPAGKQGGCWRLAVPEWAWMPDNCVSSRVASWLKRGVNPLQLGDSSLLVGIKLFIVGIETRNSPYWSVLLVAESENPGVTPSLLRHVPWIASKVVTRTRPRPDELLEQIRVPACSCRHQPVRARCLLDTRQATVDVHFRDNRIRP
jgi:hypothetical protein